MKYLKHEKKQQQVVVPHAVARMCNKFIDAQLDWAQVSAISFMHSNVYYSFRWVSEKKNA